jgi:hypothetical protein
VAEGKSVVVATHDVGEMDAPFDDGLFLVAGEAVPPPPAAAGWLGIQASAREPE